MLLKSTSNEDNEVCYYNSSNVLCSKYIISEKKLAIIFSSGRQYVFENVNLYHYTRFKMANSQGIGFNSHIRKNYKHSQLVIVDVEDIKKQIEGLKS